MDPARRAAVLRPPLRAVPHPTRPGGHGFADDAANGTAAAAFRFALEGLTSAPTSHFAP